MPKSKEFGKVWISAVYERLYEGAGIRDVIDIGAGRGTYSKLLRDIYQGVRWTGIEVWEPYVGEFMLNEKYEKLVIGDARTLDLSRLGRFDVAFMGDILEHMRKKEAMMLVNNVLEIARFVFVSVPIVYSPQEKFKDNPFEIHIKPDWCHEEAMASFPFIRAWYVEGINGIYILARDERDESVLMDILKRLDRNVIQNKIKFGCGRISSIRRLKMRAYYLASKPLRPFYYSVRRKLGRYKEMLVKRQAQSAND